MLEFGLTALLGLSVVFAFAYTSYQFFRIVGKVAYVLSGKPEIKDKSSGIVYPNPVTGAVHACFGFIWVFFLTIGFIVVYYITVLLSLLGTYIMSLLTGA